MFPKRIADHIISSGTDDIEQRMAMVAESLVMERVLSDARRVAGTDSTVLVTGETGCGKGALVKYIHSCGARRNRNFITVDCGAIPDTLIESELFGSSKGAYTGSTRERPGLLEMADGGTLFLDEIGELSYGVQKKLLRVLEERTFSRLGDVQERRTNARIVAATNRDLEEESRNGLFRRDLFFRIRVIHFELPPLRARKEDIIPLAEHFARRKANQFGVEFNGFDGQVVQALSRFEWPGNVRELAHAMEHAVTFGAGKKISLADIPSHIAAARHLQELKIHPPVCLKTTLDETSRDYIEKLLHCYSGNVTKAARAAGLNRRQLHRLLNKHKLDADAFRNEGRIK